MKIDVISPPTWGQPIGLSRSQEMNPCPGFSKVLHHFALDYLTTPS